MADALGGLRAHEARYCKTKCGHAFTVERASKARKTIKWVENIGDRKMRISASSTPAQVPNFEYDSLAARIT